MKKLIALLSVLCALSLTALAQEQTMDHTKPTEIDKAAAIPKGGFLKRGAPLSNAKKVSLEKILANPAAYAGQTVRVDGIIVRSCKMEGCWMELAPKADAKGVMVQFKD